MAPKQEEKQQAKGTELATTGKAKGGMVSAAIDHVVAKGVPFLPPWVAAGVIPPAFGFATHELWGGDALSSGIACAGLGLSGVALSALTWSVCGGSNAFRRVRRVHATASVAAGMGWLTCATAAGPFSGGILDTWLFGGGLFAASWNVRQIMRNAHDETEEVTDKGGWGKLAEKIGMEKFQVKQAKSNGKGMVTAGVGVPAGNTLEDMQSAAPKIAAALNLPTGSVTVTRNPDDAGAGTLSARVADLLRDGVAFIPPVRMGMLPTEDIPVGLYADGETWFINPFAADILQHLLVMGVTGAGKSEFARTVLAHLMTRAKLSVFLVDVAKGRQTVGHIKDGLDWFITDEREAKHLLKGLPSAIKMRGDRLADEGLDQWTPKSSLNAIVVWLEEAADLADFAELDKIARAARSVGIWLVVSLQRATWTNISTDVRANLQATACFGVDDAGDATFCLPDKVTDSGAIPDWGSDRPGYAFATGMGIPADRWTTELRGSYTDAVRQQLVAMVQAAAAFRDPLDQVTADALGLAYAQRQHRGTNRLNTQPTAAAPAPTVRPAIEDAQDMADNITEEEEALELQETYEQVMGQIPADPEPDAEYAHIDLEGDMPEADPDSDMTFQPRPKLEAEEARAILYGEIDLWARQGRLEFEPADLGPATVEAGRKRPWMQGELARLVEQGSLKKTGHGQYLIVHSPLVPA